MLAEKTTDAGLIRRYDVGQFPTIVWTDRSGEAVAVTVQPSTPEEALKDLAVAREFLAAADEAR